MQRPYIIASIALIAAVTLAFIVPANAATFVQIFNGGTSTSTAPSYGKLLIGGKNGEYEFVASSTLGSSGSSSASSTLLSDNNTFAGIDGFTSTTTLASTTITAIGSNAVPALTIGPPNGIGNYTGIYQPYSGALGFTAGSSGNTSLVWDGFEFQPLANNSKNIGATNNIWNTEYLTNEIFPYSGTTTSQNTVSTNSQGYLQIQESTTTGDTEVESKSPPGCTVVNCESDFVDVITPWQSGGTRWVDWDNQDNAQNQVDITEGVSGAATSAPIVMQICNSPGCSQVPLFVGMPSGAFAIGNVYKSTIDQNAALQVASSTVTRIFEADSPAGTHVFDVTQSGASTTNETISGTGWLPSLGSPSGTFLAVDPNGKIIATSTPVGGSSASSTLLSDNNTFSGKNLFLASTTIGNGTNSGGLTINGYATTTGNFDLNSTGYPQGFFGPVDSSPIANIELNDVNQGNYPSFGIKANNGGGTFDASLLLDLVDQPSGIAQPLILDNLTGYANCLQIKGNGYACLNDYNTDASLFDVQSPAYNAGGTEAGFTTTMLGASGNDNTDYGIQQYPGSYPTGIDAYQNYYATTYAQPLPEPDFSFWEQANGNSSESQTAWHFLIASTTVSGTQATTTSLCFGDVGSTTPSAFTNCGVLASSPTVGIFSSSSRTTAFDVSKITNNSLKHNFDVLNNGNVGISTTTPGSLFSIAGIGNWTGATSTMYSTGGINLTSGCFSVGGVCVGSTAASSTLLTDNNTFGGNDTFTNTTNLTNGFLSAASSTVVGNLALPNGITFGYNPWSIYEDSYQEIWMQPGNPGYYAPHAILNLVAPDANPQESTLSFTRKVNTGNWTGTSYGSREGADIGCESYDTGSGTSNGIGAADHACYFENWAQGTGTTTPIRIGSWNMNNEPVVADAPAIAWFDRGASTTASMENPTVAIGNYASTTNAAFKYDASTTLQVLSTTTQTAFAVETSPRAHNLFVVIGNGNVGIGTSTPQGILTITKGASATTTVSIGELGLSTSKACVNIQTSAGTAGYFYLNSAGTIVSGLGACTP